MINWLWLIPAFVFGSCVGALLMGILVSDYENQNGRKNRRG